MTKYRIKEIIYYDRAKYAVERKSIFGWWYNLSLGFQTIDGAKEFILSLTTPVKTRIID